MRSFAPKLVHPYKKILTYQISNGIFFSIAPVISSIYIVMVYKLANSILRLWYLKISRVVTLPLRTLEAGTYLYPLYVCITCIIEHEGGYH